MPHQAPRLARWRRPVHLLAVVAGWALFVWGWVRVLAGAPDFESLRALVLGAALVVPVLTLWWILHNRGIHRRKGPRRRVPTATLDYHTDFHGLEVVGDLPALQQAQHVHVVIESRRKLYRAATAPAVVGDETPQPP